jgi:hypothetical protein
VSEVTIQVSFTLKVSYEEGEEPDLNSLVEDIVSTGVFYSAQSDSLDYSGVTIDMEEE